MPYLIVIAVVLAGFLVMVTFLGVLGGFAPRDWLLIVGISVTSALLGVLLYWTALKAWVQAGKHPFSLRIVASVAAAEAWLASFEGMFWEPITESAVWNGDTDLALAASALFILVLTGVLAAGALRPRRFRDA